MDPLGAMVDECDLPVLCFAPGTDFLIYFFDGALSDGIGRFPPPKQNETARELSLFALEKMNRKANRWTALRKTSQKNAGSACLLFGVMLS